MNRRVIVVMLAAMTVAASGCQYAKRSVPANSERGMTVSAYAASPGRYVAERQKLEVIAPDSELQKSWESAIAFCGTIKCEVVSSSITTRVGDPVPSGTVSLRVFPEDFTKLLAHVGTLGKIAQHTTEREDKTAAVVDTEAKLKNLTAFRDNLRAMLARPSATVRDLVEIQKQLTETQSELDGETARRKILANETEKIAVEISFHVASAVREPEGFARIWNALSESGSILADSTASLIITIVTVIPWLILVVPGIWLLAKAWRGFKLRRNRAAAPPPSTTSA